MQKVRTPKLHYLDRFSFSIFAGIQAFEMCASEDNCTTLVFTFMVHQIDIDSL